MLTFEKQFWLFWVLHSPCDPLTTEGVAADAKVSANTGEPVNTLLSVRPRIQSKGAYL